MNGSKNIMEQQIQEAASHLSVLLKTSNSDPVVVGQILSQIRDAVLPKPSPDESLAHERVEDALAAQRTVALLRTEARLHKNAAERCEVVMKRLHDAEQRVAERGEDDSRFRRSVIKPVETELEKKFKLAEKKSKLAKQKESEFVYLRRKANSTVAIIMKDTEIAFNKAFQAVLYSLNGVQSANGVYKICSDIDQYHKEKKTNNHRQPVPDEFDPCSPEYLQWLREEASMLLDDKSEFKDLVNYIAREYNGEAVLAPIKGYKRTVEKVQEKYSGDSSRILDLARGMVVFDTIGQLSDALKYIKIRNDAQLSTTANGKPLLVRAKDRLSPVFDASKNTGGYRDILLNLCFSSGHTVELQLHITSFLDLKNRRGHQVYEEARSIHMFNEAFTKLSYNWRVDSSPEEVEELLDEIRSGAITSLNLDYSEALWSPEAQSRLAEAMIAKECRLQDISLRSCFCGDDFLVKVLPLDDAELWSPENDHGHVGRVVRLGSKLHEGTGGRISSLGITRLVRYLNCSLRVLDLQGCLNLDWYENCGDGVANALLQLAEEMKSDNLILLPQLQELNLKSTGLTPDGMDTLQLLKCRGHLGRVNILTDDKLRTGLPRCIEKTYLGSTIVEH